MERGAQEAFQSFCPALNCQSRAAFGSHATWHIQINSSYYNACAASEPKRRTQQEHGMDAARPQKKPMRDDARGSSSVLYLEDECADENPCAAPVVAKISTSPQMEHPNRVRTHVRIEVLFEECARFIRVEQSHWGVLKRCVGKSSLWARRPLHYVVMISIVG